MGLTYERMRLEVDLVPEPAAISTTQRVVDDMSRCILKDGDLGWRLAMATYELLDNAHKYGSNDVARLRLSIEPCGTGHAASLGVQTRANPEDVEALKQLVAEMHAATDAWTFYHMLIARSAARTDGSGIGLARIWAEGDMVLDISVEGDIVRIEARLEAAQ
jgi:hypothetical protein